MNRSHFGIGILIGMGFGITSGVSWDYLESADYSAIKFKQKNPQAATIWIVTKAPIWVSIKKVDGLKAKKFKFGTFPKRQGTYILPGSHVLTIEFANFDPDVSKNPKPIRRTFSEMNVNLEPRQDYLLQYDVNSGQYSLVEGIPQD